MMDINLYGDIKEDVRKKCKILYKKSFFDKSYEAEVDKIMKLPISEIFEFIYPKNNDQ